MADGGLEIGKESLIEPNALRYSDEEYPFDQLSGDEALSKSFMQSVANSNNKPAKTGLFLTAIQIVKSMVGIGILGIPSVAKQYGVFFTVTLITLVGIMGYWSSALFLKCKNICGKSNMSTIGYYIFKSKWIIIMVNLMIIMVNLGVCMSELLIFGDTVQNIIAVDQCPNGIQQQACRDAFPFYYQKWFLKCAISVFLFPFLIVKSIEKLKFVSLTAIISISTFTILVIYNIFVIDSLGSGFSFWLPAQFSIEKAIAKAPTIFLAYSWQFNVFPIFKGMYRPTDQRNKYSMVIGYILTTALYLTVGILGYATYGNVIDTLYLNYIDPQDISKTLYIILNLTFVISTTLTIPIIFFGGRNNTIQLIKQIKDPFSAGDLYTEPKVKTQLVSDADQPSAVTQIKLNREKANLYFYLISIIIFAVLLVGSIYISDLGIIYNILGAISANAVQLTFPTLYYFMLVIKRGKKFRTRGAQFQFYFTIVMFVLSLVISLVCVAANFV
ncbi:hypothetical protein pb186bvf_002425 [Paramecium bursaria]